MKRIFDLLVVITVIVMVSLVVDMLKQGGF